MKRNRIFSILLVTVLLIAVTAMPAFATTVDFDKYIAEYTPNSFNDRTMEVGETHKPTSAVWMGSGNAVCQSSDASVVTVSEDGVVTAVGEGTAYVAYIVSTGMYSTYRYTVTEVFAEPTEEVDIEISLEPVAPTFSAGLELPDMNVATENGTAGVLATVMVVLGTIGSVAVAVIGMIASFGGFLLLAVPILAFGIYLFSRMMKMSSTSMKKRELPARQETENTVKVPVAPYTTCPKCGKEFGDSEFCPVCGTAKQRKNVYTFAIEKPMPAQKFEEMANQWLAENPYIYDCKLRIDYKSSLLSPLVDKKFFINKASIEFFVADQPRQEQYGFAFLYKFRLFGPIGYNNEKHVEEWKQNNPDSTVISQRGGRIQHFGSNGGFYAQYYTYVFFKN